MTSVSLLINESGVQPHRTREDRKSPRNHPQNLQARLLSEDRPVRLRRPQARQAQQRGHEDMRTQTIPQGRWGSRRGWGWRAQGHTSPPNLTASTARSCVCHELSRFQGVWNSGAVCWASWLRVSRAAAVRGQKSAGTTGSPLGWVPHTAGKPAPALR